MTDQEEIEQLRESLIVALSELQSGRSAAAKRTLIAALDGTNIKDTGRESARIIAYLYRQVQSQVEFDETPTVQPMTEKERDDSDEIYRVNKDA